MQAAQTGNWKSQWLLIGMLALAIAACACARTTYMVKSDGLEPALASGKAAVYFLQRAGESRPEQIQNQFDQFQIWDGTNLVALSQPKSYFVYQCDPGKHLFIGTGENRVAVEAQVAAGKAYCILLDVQAGRFKSRVVMLPVTKGSELWDKVDGMKRGLTLLVPEQQQITRFSAAKQPEAIARVDYFTTNPERGKLISQMGLEDGR